MFVINFWAWALLSPLGPSLKDSLGLSSFQQALLVAIPVIVGSVGRIPVGALTDSIGLILLAVVAALAIALSFETGRRGATVERARASAA